MDEGALGLVGIDLLLLLDAGELAGGSGEVEEELLHDIINYRK